MTRTFEQLTERERLELAAKAAGYVFVWGAQLIILATPPDAVRPWRYWNPRDDDGDALRLAVRLNMNIEITDGGSVYACGRHGNHAVPTGEDKASAVRLAIFRAAVDAGSQMQ